MSLDSALFFGHILPSFFERLGQLIFAPAHVPDMIWITLPLLFTLFLMEVYFGRYRKEELGWNTAVGNSLVLIFVSIDLLRKLHNGSWLEMVFFESGKTALAVAVGLGGLLISYYDFFHILPKSLAFKMSSSLPVNFVAYVSIVIVYSDFLVDWYGTLAIFALFLVLLLVFKVIRLFEPKVGYVRAAGLDRFLRAVFHRHRRH